MLETFFKHKQLAKTNCFSPEVWPIYGTYVITASGINMLK